MEIELTKKEIAIENEILEKELIQAGFVDVDGNKIEKIDKQFLENIFSIEPEIEDLKNTRNLLDKWILELKDNNH